MQRFVLITAAENFYITEISMAIIGIDHFNIACSDLEKTAEFYCKSFGFKRGTYVENNRLKLLALERGSETLEVIQPLGEDAPECGEFRHIAFASDDIYADFKKFKNEGFDVVSDGVQEIDHAHYFFIKGISGEMIEIFQKKALK